jgi:hypothetical protein
MIHRIHRRPLEREYADAVSLLDSNLHTAPPVTQERSPRKDTPRS